MRHRNRNRVAFRVETLEGRATPSGGLHGPHDLGDDKLPRHSGQDEVAGHNTVAARENHQGGHNDPVDNDPGDDNHNNRHGGR